MKIDPSDFRFARPLDHHDASPIVFPMNALKGFTQLL